MIQCSPVSARTLAFLALILTACASTGNVVEETQRLRDRHRQRFEAMELKDYDALTLLHADDLVYVHSTGTIEDKQTFIDRITSGAMRYRSIDATDPHIRIYGDTAIVTGRGDFAVTVDKVESDVDLQYTAVYRKSGRVWRLVSWQSTNVQP
jgi:ketosteroid isomerase-like protein